MSDFRCSKCHKKQNEWELDMRQRVATCKACAPQYTEERLADGPWLNQMGRPVAVREMT